MALGVVCPSQAAPVREQCSSEAGGATEMMKMLLPKMPVAREPERGEEGCGRWG